MRPRASRRWHGAAAVVVAALAGPSAVGPGGGALLLPPAGAATSAGAARIVTPSGGAATGGGSRTEFTVELPAGAACRGDSAKGNYRIQSYVVPISTDLETLTFAPGVGPTPVDGEFRAPLYEATFSANTFVDRLTAVAVPEGGPGIVIQPLPTFSFAALDPAFGFPFPPGAYHLGIACTLGPPSPAQQEKHWNAEINVVPDLADAGPAKIKWVVTPPATGGDSGLPVGWVALVALAAAALAGGAYAVRRASAARRPRASRPQTAEETR